jgi:hypothetical protein
MEKVMVKKSTLTALVVALAGISSPAFAQYYGNYGDTAAGLDEVSLSQPLYNYAPAPLFVWSRYSNHPAAAGGGSYGYNVDTLRDN